MFKSFAEFLAEAHRYKNVCDNSEMEYIFNNIISKEENIIKMVNAIKHNITPVSVCAKEIEDYVDSLGNAIVTFDRENIEKNADVYRQAIGAMVAFILKPLGYETQGVNRHIPTAYRGKYLSTGAMYEQTGQAAFKIIQKIVPIE